MKIGSNIAALRKEKGITQEELANALGVSAQAVSKWENNSSCPDVSLLTVIADYFGVTVDALLRSGAEEITRADSPSTDNNVAAVRGGKRNVRIKVTQPNGKETNVKVPFGVVKMGLRVGNVFGLQGMSRIRSAPCSTTPQRRRISSVLTAKTASTSQ